MPGPDPDRDDDSKKRDSGGLRAGLKAAGSSLMRSGSDEMDRASSERIAPVQYRSGGRVRKTGKAILHKNERVIPANNRHKVERLMKRSGIRMTTRRKQSSR